MDRYTKKKLITASLAFLGLYFFVASTRIPRETVLVPFSINSLETTHPPLMQETVPLDRLSPFNQNKHVGYVDDAGIIVTNQVQKGYVSLSQEYWTDYMSVPDTIEIKDPYNNVIMTIQDPQGYPVFLDNRIFIVGPECQLLQEINQDGSVAWTYYFAAPVTTLDAKAGLVAAGSLDGTIELLDNQGKQIFSFIPGGSRLSTITGCALSQDGSKLALVSGVDQQRFLFLERLENAGIIEYRVVYHEFLDEGLRKPMHVEFVNNDMGVVFERQGGLGFYNTILRYTVSVEFEGDMIDMDASNNDRLVCMITALNNLQKHFVIVRLPDTLIMEAPFKSYDSFLSRSGRRITVGGGSALAIFEMEKR
jgi:hypothetical protein